MAGIGFELRKLLRDDALFGAARAYAYAGIISAGPWVLSILGILVIGLLTVPVVRDDLHVSQFQVTVLYLIAGSLLFTGAVQLAFTRFTADRLYERRIDAVWPNLVGLLLLVTALALLAALTLAATLFSETSPRYRLLGVAGFVVLCDIWVVTIFLSGMKAYRAILWLFALGYGSTLLLARGLAARGLEGLLAGFVLGQSVLLLGMVLLVAWQYPSRAHLAFEFLQPRRLYPSLIAVGFFYNLGIWMDKLMFWYYPATSQAVIGPLRASVIYDMPVFLAYLSIIPGMAVFLVRMETDFVEYYERFYRAVREGGSLAHIGRMRDGMVECVRSALHQIMKVQAVAVLVVIVVSERLLEALGISTLYQPLLLVNVIAAGLQVVFLGVLNVFFYLDRRRVVLGLTSALVALNAVLTALTLQLGPTFYGYGFALALLLVVMAGLWLLDRKLSVLEYETFMLQ